jgi:hypothetical protein
VVSPGAHELNVPLSISTASTDSDSNSAEDPARFVLPAISNRSVWEMAASRPALTRGDSPTISTRTLSSDIPFKPPSSFVCSSGKRGSANPYHGLALLRISAAQELKREMFACCAVERIPKVVYTREAFSSRAH